MESIQEAVLSQLKAIASEQFKPFQFQQIPIIVAFSGGLDSSVLLHACSQLLQKNEITQLSAVHVNHGLQAQNEEWQQHCEAVCLSYKIELRIKAFNLSKQGAESENDAREARYQFFAQLLSTPGIMLFAHHLDDQAETILFRIIRGTGIHGLAGIPTTRALAKGWMIRPLMDHTREALEAYAEKFRLTWVDDPSNQQNDYSRNFLRNQVFTQIRSKWPQFSRSFKQLSKRASEQSQILDEVAKQDIQAIKQFDESLSRFQFNQLSKIRRKNLLHYWVRLYCDKPTTAMKINQVISQLEQSCANSIKIKLGSGWLLCYQKQLYFCAHSEPNKLTANCMWEDLSKPLILENGITLNFIKCSDPAQSSDLALRKPDENEVVTVRPRAGGEIAKPSYRAHRAELKKIFQELKIPTWKREWLPIIYYDEKLAAIPGVFVDQAFASKESGYQINMQLKSESVSS